MLLLLPPVMLQTKTSTSWQDVHRKLASRLFTLLVFMIRHLQQTVPDLPELPKGFRHQEVAAAVQEASDDIWQTVCEDMVLHVWERAQCRCNMWPVHSARVYWWRAHSKPQQASSL